MTWTCQGQTSNGLELSTKNAKTAHNLQVHLWWKEQKRTPSNSCLEKLCQVLAYGQENQNSWPTSSTKQSFLISKIIHVHSSLFIMVSCGKSIIYEENWPRNKIYDWCAWLTLWKAKGNRLKKVLFYILTNKSHARSRQALPLHATVSVGKFNDFWMFSWSTKSLMWSVNNGRMKMVGTHISSSSRCS